MIKIFDTSKIGEDGKKILEDFFARRKQFDEYILENKLKIFTCPCCGYPTLSARGIYIACSICDWEDDGQDDHEADEVWGGPNYDLSLTEGRLQIGRILREFAIDAGKKSVNLGWVMLQIESRDKKLKDLRTAMMRSDNYRSRTAWDEFNKIKHDSLAEFVLMSI